MIKNKVKYSIMLILLPFFSNASFEIGVGTHLDRYKYDSVTYLKLLQQYGFTSFRDDYTWSKVEKVKNKYKVDRTLQQADFAFMNSKSYNVNGMVILAYGNMNYDFGKYPTSDEAIKGFANYASWTAKRFKGRVKYYEIWNEWIYGTGMAKARDNIPSAENYYNLVKATSLAIKKNDPDAIILAGSFNPLNERSKLIGMSDSEWFDLLVEKGIMKYIDGVSIHTYSFSNRNKALRNAEGNVKYLDKFHQAYLDKYNINIKMYITEYGVPIYNGPGGSNEKNATDTIREYITEIKKRDYIKGIWLYDLIDDGTDKSNKEHNFGMFYQDMQPKSSALQIKSLNEQ
ncbi:cellulase family glycosylhydrolase [Klebsiella quasipneumoniae]|uniref:cellulase family glycosylhydrolase n=1 Tax=Klebsiella TaxID=570 RepID=UPI001C256CA3|nr:MULTISPECIES: cellulase family glycosylhydrolase [Klebsiella]MBU8951104.1 hypothetical protein [Klebsiella quasipneumoniae]MBY0592835.1 hypothetical protein [Klebsiella sp. TFW1]MBY0603505.1 hypothetical protein [Klebsiella sp. TF21-TM]MCD7063899.1 hypothetical protein [Klebsiella quasipneumoniae subsp. similipneumoniae]UJA26827.1 hypothetical protein HWA76_08330 [Klebsiella pneumoniae]